jgi:hypothetical protein
MLRDYDVDDIMPEYVDSRYEGCLNAEEAKVLRLVLSYCEYVELRYGKPDVFYQSFRPDKRGKSLRTLRNVVRPLTQIVEQLGNVDPALFMSYVFETWEGREHYARYAGSKKNWLTNTAGITYPSMKYITDHRDRLVKEFLAIPSYEPRGFVTRDERKRRYSKAMQGKVDRWLGANEEKTEADYWRMLCHLLPPHLNYPDIRHADSLFRHAEVVKEEFGFTVEELTEYHADLWQAHPTIPLTRVSNEEWMDEDLLERVSRTAEALSNDIDVTADTFQQELDRELNPIDLEDPDTVMYYLFGRSSLRGR